MLLNKTLFSKIGGDATIDKAVDILLSKVLSDQEMSPFFKRTDIRKLKLKKRMFFMMILGGPVRYSSKDLSTAHSHLIRLGLNTDLFQKYIGLLVETLKELGLTADLVQEIILITKGFESKILDGKSHPPIRREVQVTSLKEYIEVSYQFSENTLFRGHGRADWQLVPSIGRLSKSQVKTLLGKAGSWEKLEDEIMKRFIRHSSPILSYTPESYIEWLVIAQHHGMPTRLLDWSQNPLVSLYFAISNLSGDESAIWALDPKIVYSVDIDLSNLGDLQVYFPKNIDQKIVSQKGCFTIQPLPRGENTFIPLQKNVQLLKMSAHSFSKIVIPGDKKIKEDILIQLANCGVDETFIYPDLYGLSRQIKRDLKLGMIRF